MRLILTLSLCLSLPPLRSLSIRQRKPLQGVFIRPMQGLHPKPMQGSLRNAYVGSIDDVSATISRELTCSLGGGDIIH